MYVKEAVGARKANLLSRHVLAVQAARVVGGGSEAHRPYGRDAAQACEIRVGRCENGPAAMLPQTGFC